MEKTVKIRTNVLYVRMGSMQGPGATVVQRGPQEFQGSQSASAPPQSIESVESLFPPDVGDKIEKEGYVDLFRVSEREFVPEVPQGDTYMGNRALELRTYCLVRISAKADSSNNVVEFRILYGDLKGEQLATSAAVVAALKDAFIHRSKVRVKGEASQVEVRMMGPILKSDVYYALGCVELLRT